MSLVNAKSSPFAFVRARSRAAIKIQISQHFDISHIIHITNLCNSFTMTMMMFERSIWRINALILLIVLATDRTTAFLSLPFQTLKHNGVSLESLSPSTISKTTSTNMDSSCSRETRLFLSSKNWDKIIEDDENENEDEDDDEDDDRPPVPWDMQYNERNVIRQNKNFLAIREAAGKELTNDLYCRDPKSNVFWFIGKVARVSDVPVEQVVSRQWSLIETHASNLRPLELFPARRCLELWTAPGDSEMQVVYNDPDLIFINMERQVQGAEAVKNTMIGFQGELYQAGEVGFRTTRLDDGRPAKPETKPPSAGPGDEDEDAGEDEMRPPTEEEMERLQQAMAGKDINEFYEEQQRREGKEPNE
jgi:hypothetical protein